MVASGKMTVGGIVFGLLVLLAMGFGDGLIRAQSPAANGGTAKARNYEFRSLTHGIDYQYSEIYRINTATGATMYRDWSKKDNKNVFKPVTDSTDPGPGDYDLILLNLDKGGYAAYRIDRASGRCWLATNDNVWTTIEAAK